MRHYVFPAIALIFLMGLLWAQDARPGDAPYVPTKLEWAALELQMEHGHSRTPGYHVGISFIATADGRTVECLITYDRSVSAAAINVERQLAQLDFESYVKSRRWDWLRLGFKEIVVPG